MNKINQNTVKIIENPIILQNLCIMRDKKSNAQEIRLATRKITRVLIYEASKTLPLVEKTIQTPLSPCTTKTIDPEINIIISPILRDNTSMLLKK